MIPIVSKDTKIDRSAKQMAGMIQSYVQIHGKNPSKNLEELQDYLNARFKIRVNRKILNEHIRTYMIGLEREKKMQSEQNLLFTEENKKRRYRYGSGFCPHCKMFKNYEKECPNCSFHEITV